MLYVLTFSVSLNQNLRVGSVALLESRLESYYNYLISSCWLIVARSGKTRVREKLD